ncbi:lactonase family protein [Maribacter sp. 2304DJ31-5]|uniref:lactonase family protein n=1 Tax=Maribacter sp. 2304DJ31-5 TaxID=3386273 RepID=UPI0039BD66E4
MKKILLLVIGIVSVSCTEKRKPVEMPNLFVGTYTDGESEGIYRFSFNAETGELAHDTLVATLPNPSYLAISVDGQNLYAIQETANFDSSGGGVTAFKLKEGLLEHQNSMGTAGAHPCHIALSDNGNLVVSNYTGGNLIVADLEAKGSLKGSPQVIDHKILDSTSTSHAHMASFMNDELFVSDLGLDAVKRYVKKDGKYIPFEAQPSISLPKGAGPRHFVFGQEQRFLYVINELNSTITVFKKENNGIYTVVETKNTLAQGFKGKSFCADIHLSQDGKFLYGSNRGENTVVAFKVNQDNGQLTLVDRVSVEGDWPRNFTLDPTGKFLLVANQRSNNICVFKRDVETGTLEFLSKTNLSAPACLKFSENRYPKDSTNL